MVNGAAQRRIRDKTCAKELAMGMPREVKGRSIKEVP
jgi:hypothetical protein